MHHPDAYNEEQVLFGRPIDDFLGEGAPVFMEHLITEGAFNYKIDIYVPNFSRKELRLSIEDDLLVLVAFHAKKERRGIFQTIYREVVFKRSFVCPDDIAPHTIKARFESGILTITLPKQVIAHHGKSPFYRKDRNIKIKANKNQWLAKCRQWLGFKQ